MHLVTREDGRLMILVGKLGRWGGWGGSYCKCERMFFGVYEGA